jgi:hypothetical protein
VDARLSNRLQSTPMKKIKQDQDILVLLLPIDVGNEIAFSMAMDERVLIDTICRFADGLRKEDVEVFKREKNVIATEHGFYFAIHEQDVVDVESGNYKPE